MPTGNSAIDLINPRKEKRNVKTHDQFFAGFEFTFEFSPALVLEFVLVHLLLRYRNPKAIGTMPT